MFSIPIVAFALLCTAYSQGRSVRLSQHTQLESYVLHDVYCYSVLYSWGIIGSIGDWGQPGSSLEIARQTCDETVDCNAFLWKDSIAQFGLRKISPSLNIYSTEHCASATSEWVMYMKAPKFGPEMSNDCPVGYEGILDFTECDAAAVSVCAANRDGVVVNSGDWDHDPTGCFVRGTDFDTCSVHFNTRNPSNPTEPDRFPICQQPMHSSTTDSPTGAPSTTYPSKTPTSSGPSANPSESPMTSMPSISPISAAPSVAPTTVYPTANPSQNPISSMPTSFPISSLPTGTPSKSAPTSSPNSSLPTSTPTSGEPSASPSESSMPSISPNSAAPSVIPTTANPSQNPISSIPTGFPISSLPTGSPSASAPTSFPISSLPTATPTWSEPSAFPSESSVPSISPNSAAPSTRPTVDSPSQNPISLPTRTPSTSTNSPISSPSASPSTVEPTNVATQTDTEDSISNAGFLTWAGFLVGGVVLIGVATCFLRARFGKSASFPAHDEETPGRPKRLQRLSTDDLIKHHGFEE